MGGCLSSSQEGGSKLRREHSVTPTAVQQEKQPALFEQKLEPTPVSHPIAKQTEHVAVSEQAVVPVVASEAAEGPTPAMGHAVLKPTASATMNDGVASGSPMAGRPPTVFPQAADSRVSVYSEHFDGVPDLPVDTSVPPLPEGAHLPSDVTPAGNVLMQLDRAMIYRNRGHGAGLPPVGPSKPQPPAVEGQQDTATGSRLQGDSAASAETPRSRAVSNLVASAFATESLGPPYGRSASSQGGDTTNDSVLFEGLPGFPGGGQAHSSAAPGAGLTAANSIPQPSGNGMSTLPSVPSGSSDSIGGGLLAGGMASSVASSAMSALTAAGAVGAMGAMAGASGTGTGSLMGPLHGLGVEATLSEMQQMALIGSGGGGCVYIGRWRGVTVAIKFIVSSNDDQLVRSQREALLSRLASHPHVVQTYATSVTQLTEGMFKAKEGALGDAQPGGFATADPNISHDLLAGLTSGSWIRGELAAAMLGNPPAGTGGPAGGGGGDGGGGGGGVVGLPTILESTRSSAGSPAASHATGLHHGHSDAAAAANGSAPHSCQTSTTSSVVGAPGRLQQTGAAAAASSSSVFTTANAVSNSASGYGELGTQPGLGRSDSLALSHDSSSHATEGAQTDGLRQQLLVQQATAAANGGAAGGGGLPQGAPGAGAGVAAAVAPAAGPGAGMGMMGRVANPAQQGDSFDASFVRDHLGRAKYSIHEVLRQLGAHERQFLTMVVMEYCDGGSLLAALKEGPFHRDTTSWSPRMLLRSTVRTALEIAHGMQHLHLSGLVHGDLKPGNVLLKGSNQDKRKFVAKVSDLGIAHPVGSADEMAIDDGQIGSIAYMAPEVFKGRIMKASDVFSFGVLLWQLVCGTGASPYEGSHPLAIALGVSEGKFSLRWPQGAFRPLQQLGELCTQVDPSARPSFKSVVGALEKLERHMQRLAAASPAPGSAAAASPPTSGFLGPNSGRGSAGTGGG